jgi:GTP pyrophosphokinase
MKTRSELKKTKPEEKTVSLKTLESQVALYAPHADFALLSRAYHFSESAHEGQVRQSGEPYLQHPLEVALLLTQLQLPLSSVIAALLHDVLEDTSATEEELRDQFGSDVATMVEGVTKIGKIEWKSMEEKQAENFRKMIVSVAQDFRILLIKLADRLHNMRTLGALPEEKRQRIAQETMEIYAPLANRLGIGWMKSELEDLAFRYIKPEIYETLVKKVAGGGQERADYIERVIEVIKKTLSAHSLIGTIYGRTKHFLSIYQKMTKRGIPFEEIYDLTGIRIVTDTRMNCYAILGLVHSLWPPVPNRFRDFIAIPKSNLYQSLHTTVVSLEGKHVEIQIRSEEMHRLAEEGVAAHWVYKERGHLRERDEKAFTWLRQLMEWQEEISDTRQFMDSVKTDLFSDMVYIFTPKGDVKELLRGSTPIDFAYEVHTEVGHHCVGAKVNGKIVPLGYALENGARVEILTSESHWPHRDWLKIAKTPKAKAKIKHFIQTEERTRSLEVGKKLLERELKKARFNPQEVFKSEQLALTVKALGIPTLDDLFIGIGYGKTRADSVIRTLLPEPHFKEAALTGTQREDLEKSVVKIKGLDDILIHLSKCCTPVPGDAIIGFITRGRGISVHTVRCPNIDRFDYDQDRLVEVTWDHSSGATHSVEISALTQDKPGVLAAISTVIAEADSNISKAEILTTQDKRATLKFVIGVRDAAHLQQVLHRIEKVEGILDVHRTKQKRVHRDVAMGEEGVLPPEASI